jgi:hypothetical protein
LLFKKKLLDAKDIIGNYDSIINSRNFQTSTGYIALDHVYTNEYINHLIIHVRVNEFAKKIHLDIMKKATQLIDQINEVYHFEKE